MKKNWKELLDVLHTHEFVPPPPSREHVWAAPTKLSECSLIDRSLFRCARTHFLLRCEERDHAYTHNSNKPQSD